MAVDARAVVAEQRLRHKRRRLAVFEGGVLDDVFEYLQIVGGAQQRGIAKIYFALSGRRDFVVMTLDGDAALRQCQGNLRTEIVQSIGWRHGHITFLWPN